MITEARSLRLVVGMMCAGVSALSLHLLMLQVLHVPFPELSVIPEGFKLIIRAIATLGLLFLASDIFMNSPLSFLKKCGLLFLIDAMLTESLFALLLWRHTAQTHGHTHSRKMRQGLSQSRLAAQW